MTHLIVVLARDRSRRFRAVPLSRRAVVDDRRGLGVLPATDAFKDRLLVVDKLAESRACAHRGALGMVSIWSRGTKRGMHDSPLSILSLTNSIAVLASSSESCPPSSPVLVWISFLSHFCASHLSEALNGGPRGCW